MRTRTILIASLAAVAVLAIVGCGGSETSGTAEGSGGTAVLPNRLTVKMGEWFFDTDQPRVRAGKVTVMARNIGKIEHELIALKTDIPAHRMPMTHDGDELDLEKAGEIMIGEVHEHGDEHMDGETADEHVDEGDDHMDGAGKGSSDMAEADVEEGHLEAGETGRYEVRLQPGRYVLLCSIPGHYQSGQYASLVAVK